MLKQANDVPYGDTGSAERLVYLAAAAAWVLSFLAPPAPGPLPGVSTGMFAVLAWALVLLSTGRVVIPAASRSVVIGLSCFCVLVFAAALAGQWLDCLVLSLATLVFVFGATSKDLRWLELLFFALLIAGVVSAILGGGQVLWPSVFADFSWLAGNSATPGRAVANLGQANQLATLLNLALIASLVVSRLSRFLQLVVAVVLGAGIAFSGSRTGVFSLALVSFWAWQLRRGQANRTAWQLLVWAGFFGALCVSWLLSHNGESVFFLGQRLSGGSDISSSRFSIWRDCASLLWKSPLFGVGWGGLNWAWTMESLPDRSLSLINHSHNIHYQWVLELGWPAAVLLSAALGWLLWIGWRAVFRHGVVGVFNPMLQAAMVACLVLVLHSQLEYPLWYVYFLLPFAYWMGLFASLRGLGANESSKLPILGAGLRAAGVVVVLVSIYAVFDYSRIVRVYSPSRGAQNSSIEARIFDGRKGVIFGYYADLAYVFTRAPGDVPLDAFDRPMRHLVSPRLLKDYALALHAHGRDVEAAFMANRLREFHSPVVDEFFAACGPVVAASSPPFQCQ